MLVYPLATIFIAALLFWLFAHINFYKALKSESPETYQANSSIGIGYIGGFQWVEIALNGRYRRIRSTKVHRAARILSFAYFWHGNLTVIFLLSAALSWLVFAIKAALSANT